MVVLVRLEPGPELSVGGRVPAAAAVHVGDAGVRGAGRQRAWNQTKKHVHVKKRRQTQYACTFYCVRFARPKKQVGYSPGVRGEAGRIRLLVDKAPP